MSDQTQPSDQITMAKPTLKSNQIGQKQWNKLITKKKHNLQNEEAVFKQENHMQHLGSNQVQLEQNHTTLVKFEASAGANMKRRKQKEERSIWPLKANNFYSSILTPSMEFSKMFLLPKQLELIQSGASISSGYKYGKAMKLHQRSEVMYLLSQPMKEIKWQKKSRGAPPQKKKQKKKL